jgi:hypothetical protein
MSTPEAGTPAAYLSDRFYEDWRAEIDGREARDRALRTRGDLHGVAALVIDDDGHPGHEVGSLARATDVVAAVLGPGRNVEASPSLAMDPFLLDLTDAEYADLISQGHLDLGRDGLEIIIEMDAQ